MPILQRVICLLFVMLLPGVLTSCTVRGEAPARGEKTITLVFKHGKLTGDPEVLRRILRDFEEAHPGVRVKDEVLPASTDEQHQFYVINLEGRSADIDVLSMDIIWVPEFIRAGWIRDLTPFFPPADREQFLPVALGPDLSEGKIYAAPWYIDAGLLYFRKDLLAKYDYAPPKTWPELVRTARAILRREGNPKLYGFIWQGKQYEGLVCNVLEYIWSNNGEVIGPDGRLLLNSPAVRGALAFMRDLIRVHGVTPPLVTSAIEEPTRRIFGDGNAVFMRNWPYAWNIFQRPSSPVRGKIGVSPLPAFPGGHSAATLGGWHLGVNASSRHPQLAAELVRYLTSEPVQKVMAIELGYKPTRVPLYRDPDLRRAQPFIAELYEVFQRARPRPVTPYYMMISQVLQPEFSAVLAGIRDPARAMAGAETQIRRILSIERES
ncbi:MAG: ABC transporter substrate-binding protein [Candidatus Tectomicrobia bacterium]|uniref:ABC transporter substrate-binding protein n=1 Tax=Tectimicrobiota bacterium TaxID=2528274 RepID=A0A932GPG3_UNCTE|nr:ABC transporter substrate-binding protein [Candidatus Tectomicrobia bacterium]